MSASRLESLESMLLKFPQDRRLRYFLAMEYRKAGRPADAVAQLRAYIDAAPREDVGAAWRDLGLCFQELGHAEEAEKAFQAGIQSARLHNHSNLAAEIQSLSG